MNSNRIKIIFLYGSLVLTFCTCVRSYAQDTGQQSLSDHFTGYMDYAGVRAVIFTGEQQKGHPYTTNHPYLREQDYTTGGLSYNKVIYSDMQLRYDMSRDELVLRSPDFRNIVLFPENVDFVDIHGYHMIYFRKDSLSGCPDTGYYFVLHSGKYKLLMKQVNVLQQKTNQREIEQYYSSSVTYYLLKDDVYYRIRNKKALLEALGSHKKELQRLFRSHHLKFRKNSEVMVLAAVREYENLTASE